MAPCGVGDWHDLQMKGVCVHPQIVQQMRDQAKTFVVEDMTVEHTITGACSQGPGTRGSPCSNGSALSPFGYLAMPALSTRLLRLWSALCLGVRNACKVHIQSVHRSLGCAADCLQLMASC